MHLQFLPRLGKADLPRGEQAATGPEAVFTGFWKAESETCLFIIWTEGKLRQRGNCGKSGDLREGSAHGSFQPLKMGSNCLLCRTCCEIYDPRR